MLRYLQIDTKTSSHWFENGYLVPSTYEGDRV